MAMAACLWESKLPALGVSSLSQDEFDAIEQHVEACATCRKSLESLARPWAQQPELVSQRAFPQIRGLEIHREIARGAMGIVYLATQTGLDRQVAVKVLSRTMAVDLEPAARRRWEREARAVSTVRHPNVVPLYGFGEGDGWFHLVFEFIPGGTLKARLTRPIAPRAAATIVAAVARAVEHAHDRGVLHLDLKPSNILLDGDEQLPWELATPRVSDFGLALFVDRNASDQTFTGLRGTPAYMAPEQTQANGSAVGPTADIYALGAILFELLAGQTPFQGLSPIEMIDQVRSLEAVSPRKLNAVVPLDLDVICLKCLEKNPGRRYQTAAALGADLKAFLDGRPISARAVSGLERLWRCSLRHRMATAFTVCLALTLGIAFISVLSLWRYADRQWAIAEADFETTSDMLQQFIEVTSAAPVTKVMDDRTLRPLLENARNGILKAVRNRPDSDLMKRNLASIDRRLGSCLMRTGEWERARVVLEESLSRLRDLSTRSPLARAEYVDYLWACFGCADVAIEQYRPDEAVGYLTLAIDVGETIARRWPSGDAIVDLIQMRSSLARMLDDRGDHAGAIRLFEANATSLVPRPGETVDRANVLASRIMAALEIKRHRSRFDTSQTAATTVGAADSSVPFPGADVIVANDLPANAWAGAILVAIKNSISREAPTFHESDVGLWLCRLMANIAADERNHGNLEDSRRTVERIVELGKALVSCDPQRATAHLALSTGYLNQSKIAWKSLDYPAIERYLILAVSSARQAVALAPADEYAHFQFSSCQRRLEEFLSGRRQVAASTP
jgi:tRNA A-37 threonylcarbamoyl transferase component Bud32/tetratricopeptide (TPR) repeat protein